MSSVTSLLNAMGEASLAETLGRCCGSRAWSDGMERAAPFRDDEHLFATAEYVWGTLPREDRLEAFGAHPRIGDVESLRAKYATTKAWATGEQAGVADADQEVLQRLAKQNAAYEQRFGYLFIICATGKSAGEMLGALETRLPNDPSEELAIASAEQLKITLLRLRKLAE